MRLKRKLDRAIHRGQPWIYRDSVEDVALAPGTVVAVGEKGRPALGWGYWDATSAIAVRLVSHTRLGDVAAWRDAALATALGRRLPLVRDGKTDTFRLVHGEADGMAGVHIDLYGPYASVRFDGEGARAFYGEALAAALAKALPLALAETALPPLRGVLERKRGARADTQGAPEEARVLWGEAPVAPLLVHENGVAFLVDLLHGQKGGLFLDQRENRERIRGWAAGADVLNLFGYTGGFSLYAAKGGARSTTTVDLSSGAIATAALNFRANDLDPAVAELVAVDAFAFLEDARQRGRSWDIVISDPPSFAPNQKSLPRALAAYTHLHAQASSVVKSGGLFCAASCSSHVDGPAFLATVHEGVARTGRRWREEALFGAGVDHPVASFFPEGAYLKFAVGRIEGGAPRMGPRRATVSAPASSSKRPRPAPRR